MSFLTVPEATIRPEVLDRIKNLPELTDREREVMSGIANQLAAGETLIMAPSDTLTPAECAKQLGVSRAHFNKILDAGDLPFHIVGARDRRIKASDFQDYLTAVEATRRVAAHNAAHAEDLYFGILDDM